MSGKTVKVCSECGAENPLSEDICTSCGFNLDDNTLSSTNSSDQAGISCPQCNKAISSDMKFCDGCGASLAAPDTSSKDNDSSRDSSSVTSDDLVSPLPGPPASAPPTPDTTAPPSQPSKMTWKFKVIEGMHIGKEYLLYKDEMVIGRIDTDSDNFPDIDLEGQDDGYVSRRHAIVKIKDNQVSVQDLGGANGTMVDNRPIDSGQDIPVTHGQVVRVGKVGLMLEGESRD